MTKNYIKFKNRIIFLHIFIMVVWIGFGVRLFNIQIINKMNNPQGIKLESVKGFRGNFYDTNGKSLTQNLTFYRIGIHPKKVLNVDSLLKDLSNCTGSSIDNYSKKYNPNRDYVELEKKTNRNCEKLQQKYPNEIVISKSYKRFYPEDNLVSQLVGFTNVDDYGISGLESKYNKYLEPVSGSKLSKRNGLGLRISDPTLPSEDAKNGADIILSINKEYQAILRDELIIQMENTGSSAAMGLIINPQNGAVLSMVNLPDYNPNSPSDFEIELQKNKLVTDLIEPGSTFKIVTMAAALENNIDLMDEYNVEGPYNFHNIKMIEDSEPHNVLNVKEILAFSSNIGTIKIAESLGKKSIYNQAREFGFGIKTGFDTSTEASGIFRDPSKWSLSSMHSIPIGYEISATPIQIAMAYAAIANGGFLLKPYVVEKIEKHDDIIIKNQRSTKKRVLSQSNAEKLKIMLSHTVNKGSGKKAEIKGWDVAGKTGTSKKLVNGQYSDKDFISSFVGFFPSENPQLLCLIVLDSPDASRNLHWGSMSAAPVFKSVMDRVINIDKSITISRSKSQTKKNEPLLIQKNLKTKIEYVEMPDLYGKTVRDAFSALKKIGIKPQISGRGLIVSQSIAAGQKVEKKSICILKAELKE
jgi:cell division protein FtsI (penicillin-binding protein 3)